MKNNSQISNSKPHNFIRRFVIGVIVLLAAIALLVICIDPFFHYHEPWFGLKAVLTDKEYQCVGSLKNFDYDNLIVGSSVTENNNNAWFDEAFGGKQSRPFVLTAELQISAGSLMSRMRITGLRMSITTSTPPLSRQKPRPPSRTPAARCISMMIIRSTMLNICSIKMCCSRKFPT